MTPTSRVGQLDDERLLTVTEVCQLIRVAPTFVYRHAAELGAIKVGSHLRFTRRGLDSWLDARRMPDDADECRTHVDNRIVDRKVRGVGRRTK